MLKLISFLILSCAVFAQTPLLTLMSDDVKTPEEILADAYKSRVVADGGEVIDESSVIPVRAVMYAGMGWPGFTKVRNSPSTSPPRTFTAPISVIPAPR